MLLDLFPDNTLFNEERLLAVLDFEEAGKDAYLYDLATAINGFCFKLNNLSEQLKTTLLTCYEKYRKLTSLEKENLFLYISWSAYTIAYYHLNRGLENGNITHFKRALELLERAEKHVGI